MSEGSVLAHSAPDTLAEHGPYERKRLTPKAVDRLIKSTTKKPLIRKRIHPHVMRHTFATTLLDNGNDLKTVQPLMGHSHIPTTERYLQSTDDRRIEAIRSLQFG
jgi:site-specific recombinase XerD